MTVTSSTMRKFALTTKHTKVTKDSKMIIFNVVRLVTSFEIPVRGEFINDESRYAEYRSISSYPRKRVSRLIGRRTILDSRLRGNDESQRTCSIFIFCGRA